MSAPTLALWLAHNTHAIAANQHAGTCYNDIQHAINTIEHTINRPIPPKCCGPCPTPTARRQICGQPLEAKRDDIEIICPKCQTTHNVEHLIQDLLNQVDYQLFSRSELLLVMKTLGEPLPSRTFHDWCAKGKLQPRGTRYSDGRERAVYQLADVRRLKRAC